MLTLITLVNDRELFARCRASLHGARAVSEWIDIEPNPRGWNAARALNHGIALARTPWVVCVHQDVIFDQGWDERFEAILEAMSSSVAVVGLSGVRPDGRYRGHIVDPNGHCLWGPLPSEVLVVDEVVIAIRRSSSLKFDEDVPGFHCYGAELCLRARAEGHKVMSVDAPVTHLSSGSLGPAHGASARWLLERWGPSHGFILPTPATIIEDVTRASFVRRMLFRWRRRLDRRKVARTPAH